MPVPKVINVPEIHQALHFRRDWILEFRVSDVAPQRRHCLLTLKAHVCCECARKYTCPYCLISQSADTRACSLACALGDQRVELTLLCMTHVESILLRDYDRDKDEGQGKEPDHTKQTCHIRESRGCLWTLSSTKHHTAGRSCNPLAPIWHAD
jgi:hypothetical protein